MATPTGHAWGDPGYVQKGAGDWNDDALADNATETSDALAFGTKSAAWIGGTLVEDNTGAIDGVVTIYILGIVGDDAGADVYQEPDIGNTFSFTVTPIQNDTVQFRLPIDPKAYGTIKVAIKNEAGQEVVVTVEFNTADVPIAVA